MGGGVIRGKKKPLVFKKNKLNSTAGVGFLTNPGRRLWVGRGVLGRGDPRGFRGGALGGVGADDRRRVNEEGGLV